VPKPVNYPAANSPSQASEYIFHFVRMTTAMILPVVPVLQRLHRSGSPQARHHAPAMRMQADTVHNMRRVVNISQKRCDVLRAAMQRCRSQCQSPSNTWQQTVHHMHQNTFFISSECTAMCYPLFCAPVSAQQWQSLGQAPRTCDEHAAGHISNHRKGHKHITKALRRGLWPCSDLGAHVIGAIATEVAESQMQVLSNTA